VIFFIAEIDSQNYYKKGAGIIADKKLFTGVFNMYAKRTKKFQYGFAVNG
jgi:hypothetical protein